MWPGSSQLLPGTPQLPSVYQDGHRGSARQLACTVWIFSTEGWMIPTPSKGQQGATDLTTLLRTRSILKTQHVYLWTSPVSIFRRKLVEGNLAKESYCGQRGAAVSKVSCFALSIAPRASGPGQRVHGSTMGSHSGDSLPPRKS